MREKEGWGGRDGDEIVDVNCWLRQAVCLFYKR